MAIAKDHDKQNLHHKIHAKTNKDIFNIVKDIEKAIKRF